MTNLDIQQALATAETKLSTAGYSDALKATQGLTNYCGSPQFLCLLLFRYAVYAWDNRTGAINPYDLPGLNRMVAKLIEL